ncbi:hypothetical protein CK621_14170, partial [Vandammella animalimorsus]
MLAAAAGVMRMRSEDMRDSPWRIMAPVRERVGLAVALACASAALGVGALACLALALRALLLAPGQ